MDPPWALSGITGKVPLLVCMKLVGSGLGNLQRAKCITSDLFVTNIEFYPSLNINVFVKICPNVLLFVSDSVLAPESGEI